MKKLNSLQRDPCIWTNIVMCIVIATLNSKRCIDVHVNCVSFQIIIGKINIGLSCARAPLIKNTRIYQCAASPELISSNKTDIISRLCHPMPIAIGHAIESLQSLAERATKSVPIDMCAVCSSAGRVYIPIRPSRVHINSFPHLTDIHTFILCFYFEILVSWSAMLLLVVFGIRFLITAIHLEWNRLYTIYVKVEHRYV